MTEIGVDIGGTFTDLVLLREDGAVFHTKVPTTRSDPIVGVRAGVERILGVAAVRAGQVARFVHGSTVAINALLERKGARTGLLMTRGFEDTIEIGRQKRSRMYDLLLVPETPTFMAPRARRAGIDERIGADGAVVRPLDEDEVRRACRRLVEDTGVDAIAVCFLFSFLNPTHEIRTRQLIGELYPEMRVSISSEVDPQFREYERCVVTTVDAYLHGAVGDYLERLGSALHEMGVHAPMHVMQSRGGLTSARSVAKRPVTLLLSGLAAGVVGSQSVAARAGHEEIISLDMGGTSCDIALISAGKPLLANQARVAGLPLRAQMIDVNTIGAGGGSIAWVDEAGGLRVGPQSAGAEPGPACYGRGGTDATVTDASVLLGYLNPETFGDGALALDIDASHAAIRRLGDRLGLDPVRAAAGIHRIVDARMADEVRRVSVQRGYDPRSFSLLVLGGAGPLHGAAVAIELGMQRILVPETPGVLSAYGLLVANVEHDQTETFAVRADAARESDMRTVLERLDACGAAKMKEDGVDPAGVEVTSHADMRYVGQSYELTVQLSENDILPRAIAAFHAIHQTCYGHCDPARPVEFVNMRTVHVHRLQRALAARGASAARPLRPRTRKAYFESCGGFVETPVYMRNGIEASSRIEGPAIIEQPDTTVVVHPGQCASVLPDGSLLVESGSVE